MSKLNRLWPLPSQSSLCPNKPPTECAFWGDFGMALKAGRSDSVDSLIRQPAFWASFDMSVITPGYRVRAAGPKPSVQFGLGVDDLRAEGSSFVLDLTTGQVSGGLMVTQGSLTFPSSGSPSTPLLFDTGAFPTIHAEACEQTSNPPDFPIALPRASSVKTSWMAPKPNPPALIKQMLGPPGAPARAPACSQTGPDLDQPGANRPAPTPASGPAPGPPTPRRG